MGLDAGILIAQSEQNIPSTRSHITSRHEHVSLLACMKVKITHNCPQLYSADTQQVAAILTAIVTAGTQTASAARDSLQQLLCTRTASNYPSSMPDRHV